MPINSLTMYINHVSYKLDNQIDEGYRPFLVDVSNWLHIIYVFTSVETPHVNSKGQVEICGFYVGGTMLISRII